MVDMKLNKHEIIAVPIIRFPSHHFNFVVKVGSHDPILVQLSFQIFLCMMKNVGVHTIQFSHLIIS